MRHIYIRALLLSAFITGNCFAAKNIVISNNGDVFLQLYFVKQSNDIMIFNSKVKNYIPYYSIPNQGKCHPNYISLEPTSSKVAISGGCIIRGGKNLDQEVRYSFLTIVNLNTGKEIISFQHATPYSFSPNGDAIVYSEQIPGAPWDPSPTPPGYKGGLWLYDFNQKTKKRIDTKVSGWESNWSRYVWDLNWSEHDGNIYVTDHRDVFRYNPKTGKGEIIPYKGIYFSPDGKYYVRTGIESPASLYRTYDNKRMSEWENIIIAESESKYSEIYLGFWSKKLNSVVFRITNTENVIFDVGKGKVIGKFYGGVLGTNAEGSLVAVHPVKPDNKSAYDPSQVEVINLLDVVSKYQSEK